MLGMHHVVTARIHHCQLMMRRTVLVRRVKIRDQKKNAEMY